MSSGTAGGALLEVEGLSKRFGGLQAVDGVTLAAREGAITALIGPNGAGKTTVFALVSGFLRPDAGQVRFDGRDILGMAPHVVARLGMTRTFQIVQPFAGQTVAENIAIGAHLHVRSRREALDRAHEVAERLGLGDQLGKDAASLTIAGRKRLEMAKALATRPRLLLLDEVLAGLNPGEVDRMLPVVRDLAASGVTILMIEHVMQAVMSLADDIYVIANGRPIAHGAPAAIARDERVIESYLGHGTAARLAAREAAPAAEAAR